MGAPEFVRKETMNDTHAFPSQCANQSVWQKKFISTKEHTETEKGWMDCALLLLIKRWNISAPLTARLWYLIIYSSFACTYVYTGCNRRNGPDFGRVFLRSNYTDITQNTYIQIERLQRYWPEKRVDFFGVCILYSFPWRHSPLSLNCIPRLQLM